MTYDDFCMIAREETALLPDYVYKELNGGVLTDPAAYPHPARLSDDLYILGTYSVNSVFGRQIVLYYGSFVAVFADAEDEVYRRQIRETIRHEFRHHLESRAGLYGEETLIEEDKNAMIRYFMKHGKR